VAQELGIKRGNVIISINGWDAVRLPELEDYFLSLGWDYLMDKSTRVKEFKVCPGGGLQYRTSPLDPLLCLNIRNTYESKFGIC